MPGRHLSRTRAASAAITGRKRKVRKPQPIKVIYADGYEELVSAKRFKKEHPPKK